MVPFEGYAVSARCMTLLGRLRKVRIRRSATISRASQATPSDQATRTSVSQRQPRSTLLSPMVMEDVTLPRSWRLAPFLSAGGA